MGSWRLIVDPPGEPAANMAADEEIARLAAQESRPILRVYGWARPAVSLGRRQREEYLPPAFLQEGLPRVRRPTGGGAVHHRPDELTYAFSASRFSLPPGVPLREIACLLHRRLRETAITRGWVKGEELSLAGSDPDGPAPVCFSAPACGDLLYRGKKVAGSALRVWNNRILLQGALQGFPLGYDRLVEAFALAAERGFGREEALPISHP